MKGITFVGGIGCTIKWILNELGNQIAARKFSNSINYPKIDIPNSFIVPKTLFALIVTEKRYSLTNISDWTNFQIEISTNAHFQFTIYKNVPFESRFQQFPVELLPRMSQLTD